MKTLIFIVTLISFPYITHSPARANVNIKYVEEEKTIESYHIVSQSVRATVYHAVVEQCDSDPFITADGSFIDTARAHKLRWCAVSRDLLGKRRLKMGDTIHIVSPYKEINGVWRVKDKMGRYFWCKLTQKQAKKKFLHRKNNPKEYRMRNNRLYQKVYQANWVDFLSHPKLGIKGSWHGGDIVILKKTRKKIKVVKALQLES